MIKKPKSVSTHPLATSGGSNRSLKSLILIEMGKPSHREMRWGFSSYCSILYPYLQKDRQMHFDCMLTIFIFKVYGYPLSVEPGPFFLSFYLLKIRRGVLVYIDLANFLVGWEMVLKSATLWSFICVWGWIQKGC